ncbi:MAG TPA: tetratricopeptide repeat protein, partial [Vicinamibacteria bacterium]|nr:tetratricopeptide repeat protein [Vicinamibacteria bacterium]
EQRRPLLLFFRNNCGGGDVPTNPIAVGGPVEHQEGLSQCDRMQDDVWESAPAAALAERYLAVVVDGGDATLETRYQVVKTPTTLITDPWGNEIVRTTGYLERDKMARILTAIPRDFSPLAAAGRTLKGNPTDFGALFSAGQFYEGAGLPQVSERLYAGALASPGASDVSARRQVVIARGLNLMAHLNHADQAAGLFEKELGAAPEGPGSDALLLGLVNAQVAQGHRPEAETAVKRLDERFPGSPYTARAKQILALARK